MIKGFLLGTWNVIDPIYYKFTRLTLVPENDQNNTLIRVRITRYRGDPVILKDGTVIHKNDLLLKIHLHNARMLKDLYQIKSEIKRAIYVYQMVKKALPQLAKYVLTHQKNNEIKGLIGITGLYGGANRLGFEVIPIRNVYYRLFKKRAWILINLLANKTKNKAPVYLFMSKGQLVKKYTTY